MAYGMLVWIAAVVAQVQEPAAKQAVGQSVEASKPPGGEKTSDRVKEAQRLLRNGRYAEAEENLKEIRDASKKAPGG